MIFAVQHMCHRRQTQFLFVLLAAAAVTVDTSGNVVACHAEPASIVRVCIKQRLVSTLSFVDSIERELQSAGLWRLRCDQAPDRPAC
jgi:hypothetical protein